MNTDRELLELAAKAAGMKMKGWTDTAIHGAGWGAMLTVDGVGERTWWNPLSDDGDALRLLVKLRLDLEYDEEDGSVEAYRRKNDSFYVAAEHLLPDPCAATRRAIVTAAAELGGAK